MTGIDSQKILYPKGNNDECYTPIYAVMPLLKYLPPNKTVTVWCPFDTEDSAFVKVFSLTSWIRVVHSHIDNGQDFYTYEPDHWDIMVSNPPFTKKRQIFERALSFGKPFALLMSLTWLNDKYSKYVFVEAKRTMQLLMFDKRIKFLSNDKVENKITFSSGYYCSDFLPRDIVLEDLKI